MAKVGFWLRGSRGKLAGASMGRGAKGETIVREIVTPKNPRTVAQCMQRMKIAPAQKFFNAFEEMLSNAFEGVQYGSESRRYFIGKVMRLEGPYIQKGVDRFIPAAYPFSEGSIPSVPIKAFNGGTNLIVLDLQSAEPGITPQILADALNVTTEYQISVVVVNNNNGLFIPSYIGYEDRLTIAELPANSLTKQDGNIALHIHNLGLDNTNVVAACVVLSKQDAGGKWLRSTQDMVISNELIASLYSVDALNTAVASYSSDAANTINSEWYYNLGIAQPWPGKLITANVEIEVGDILLGAQKAVIGVKQVNGTVKNTLFVDSLTNPTKQAMVVGGALKLNGIPQPIIDAGVVATFAANGYSTEEWKDIYANQLSIYYTSTDESRLTGLMYWRDYQGQKVLVNAEGKVIAFTRYDHEFDPSSDSVVELRVSGGVTGPYAVETVEEGDPKTQAAVQAWGVELYHGYYDGGGLAWWYMGGTYVAITSQSASVNVINPEVAGNYPQ